MAEKYLSREDLIASLPSHMHNNLTDESMKYLEALLSDKNEREMLREHILCHTTVLRDSSKRYRFLDYLKAIRLCSYHLMGHSQKKAWELTNPEKAKELKDKDKPCDAYASIAFKGQMVQQILSQSAVPSYLLNQGLEQQALTRLVVLMKTAPPVAAVQAAKAVLDHCKVPEKVKIEADINVKDDGSLEELKKTVGMLALKQKNLVENGVMTTKEVAHSDILGSSNG